MEKSVKALSQQVTKLFVHAYMIFAAVFWMDIKEFKAYITTYAKKL